jgi:hypothetical protein
MVGVDDFAALRREVERLRAENARLSPLLDLRGKDTAPAPEQLAAPVAAPGLVTMTSPVRDKLALFTNLFQARTDVYATRWENRRTGNPPPGTRSRVAPQAPCHNAPRPAAWRRCGLAAKWQP